MCSRRHIRWLGSQLPCLVPQRSQFRRHSPSCLPGQVEGDLRMAPARVCLPRACVPPFCLLWGFGGSILRSARAKAVKSWILGQEIVVLAAFPRLALLLSPLFFFFICHKCFLDFENTRLSQLYSGKEFGTASNAGRLLPRIEAKQGREHEGAHCICCRFDSRNDPAHLLGGEAGVHGEPRTLSKSLVRSSVSKFLGQYVSR